MMQDLDDVAFSYADLAEEEVPAVVPEKKEKKLKVQELAAQLKDLRAKTTAELGSVASLHRVLKCLPYAKNCKLQ